MGDNELFSPYPNEFTAAVMSNFIVDTCYTYKEISSLFQPLISSKLEKYIYSPLVAEQIEIFHNLSWSSLVNFRWVIWTINSVCIGTRRDARVVKSHLFNVHESTNWVSNSLELLPRGSKLEEPYLQVADLDEIPQLGGRIDYAEAPCRWDADVFLESTCNNRLLEISILKFSVEHRRKFVKIKSSVQNGVYNFIDEYAESHDNCDMVFAEALNLEDECPIEHKSKGRELNYVRLQAIFRGFLLRKKLKEIEANVRYVDEDIESIEKDICNDEIGLGMHDNRLFHGTPEYLRMNSMAYGDHVRRRTISDTANFFGTNIRSSIYTSGVTSGDHVLTECHVADNFLKEDIHTCPIKNSEEKDFGLKSLSLNESKVIERLSNDTPGLKTVYRIYGGNYKASLSTGSKMRQRQRRKRKLPAWMQFHSGDGRNHN